MARLGRRIAFGSVCQGPDAPLATALATFRASFVRLEAFSRWRAWFNLFVSQRSPSDDLGMKSVSASDAVMESSSGA